MISPTGQLGIIVFLAGAGLFWICAYSAAVRRREITRLLRTWGDDDKESNFYAFRMRELMAGLPRNLRLKVQLGASIAEKHADLRSLEFARHLLPSQVALMKGPLLLGSVGLMLFGTGLYELDQHNIAIQAIAAMALVTGLQISYAAARSGSEVATVRDTVEAMRKRRSLLTSERSSDEPEMQPDKSSREYPPEF